MISAHDGLALGSSLEVHPTMRRRGIARSIYQAGLPWLITHQVTTLLLEIQPSTAPESMTLCQKLGFTRSHAYHYREGATLPEPKERMGPGE